MTQIMILTRLFLFNLFEFLYNDILFVMSKIKARSLSKLSEDCYFLFLFRLSLFAPSDVSDDLVNIELDMEGQFWRHTTNTFITNYPKHSKHPEQHAPAADQDQGRLWLTVMLMRTDRVIQVSVTGPCYHENVRQKSDF